MQYETPELLLVGSANSVVLGGAAAPYIDRMPESDGRKASDLEEGLDE